MTEIAAFMQLAQFFLTLIGAGPAGWIAGGLSIFAIIGVWWMMRKAAIKKAIKETDEKANKEQAELPKENSKIEQDWQKAEDWKESQASADNDTKQDRPKEP